MRSTKVKKLARDLIPPIIWRIGRDIYSLGVHKAPLESHAKNHETIKIDEQLPTILNYLTSPVFLDIPIHRIRYTGGIAFTREQHHFLQYYAKGISALYQFYENHQPRNIFDVHFLSAFNTVELNSLQKKYLCSNKLPWLPISKKEEVKGESGFSIKDGIQHYGPCSNRKIKFEGKRLKEIDCSIKRYGYIPNLDGPRGYFLVADNRRWVFHIVGGQHRVAALANQGYLTISACFQPGYPRFIRRRDAEFWPMVNENRIKTSDAKRIFDSYFRDPNKTLI